VSGKLFAFQVARPLGLSSEDQERRSTQYDPKTQLMQWQGQGRAQADIAYCTAHHNGWWYCNESHNTCRLSGPHRVTGGYYCDTSG